MKHTIAIALSGGVDSIVSAYLLKQQGHEVIGIHFITGFEPPLPGLPSGKETAISPEERMTTLKSRFSPLVNRLHLPIEIVDLSREFKETVVGYFINTYMSGRTPNPCLVCNPVIKFSLLLNKGKNFGAEKLATGHYVKNIRDDEGRQHLYRGIDPVKDQSYFLSFLNQHQLTSACFPLGDKLKADVIKLAKRENLFPVTTSESQDICFIHDKNYGDFFSRQAGFHPVSGPIVDLSGNLLGEHNGLHLFTIGQRKGINCPAPAPYYVVRIEPRENKLVVGSKADLFFSHCHVTGINWIQPEPEPDRDVLTRVRYRHHAVKSHVQVIDDHEADVTFFKTLSAVTPGQGAVFYDRDEVIGGGFIESAE